MRSWRVRTGPIEYPNNLGALSLCRRGAPSSAPGCPTKLDGYARCGRVLWTCACAELLLLAMSEVKKERDLRTWLNIREKSAR